MSDTNPSYMPAEWLGDHYRSIGGHYDSLERALSAVESHFRNTHGGGGALQVFKSNDSKGTAALIEASTTTNDPLMARAIYKVVIVHSTP